MSYGYLLFCYCVCLHDARLPKYHVATAVPRSSPWLDYHRILVKAFPDEYCSKSNGGKFPVDCLPTSTIPEELEEMQAIRSFLNDPNSKLTATIDGGIGGERNARQGHQMEEKQLVLHSTSSTCAFCPLPLEQPMHCIRLRNKMMNDVHSLFHSLR